MHPPPAGINPTIVSTSPTTIFVCDTTKLLWQRTSKPPPRAKPDGADITGYFEYLRCLQVSWKYFTNLWIDPKSPLLAKSIVYDKFTPAENCIASLIIIKGLSVAFFKLSIES